MYASIKCIFSFQVPLGPFVQSMFKGVGADFYNCKEMTDDRAAVVRVYLASPVVSVSRRALRVTFADQLANFGLKELHNSFCNLLYMWIAEKTERFLSSTAVKKCPTQYFMGLNYGLLR